MRRLAAAIAIALLAVPQSASAWGNTGHRIIGEAAVRALPAEVPAFLRTAQAALDVGELSREPDRVKGGGKTFDSDMSPSHFVDLDDDGRILTGPRLDALPPTRADYEKALQAVGQDSWKAGYLPYALVESYERLSRDFAYWRVLKAAEANPRWKANRGWFSADRRRREALILRSLGDLSHYVGDGSQPLHVSSHYNGWGDYPNPKGYSTARLHGPFESDLVQKFVKPSSVAPLMARFKSCSCPVDQRARDYLLATGRQVEPFYEMEKAGGLADGDPRGPDFARRLMAVGAAELRDLIVEAWRASEKQSVGWRPVPVTDVTAGKVNPYQALYGID